MTDHLTLAPRSILDVVAVGGLSIDMKPFLGSS